MGQRNNSAIANWPAEMRSASIVQEYDRMTYTEQYLSDIKAYHEKMLTEFPRIIESFEQRKGEFVMSDIPPVATMTLGSSKLEIHFDNRLMPHSAMHYINLRTPPVVSRSTSEMRVICEALRAYIYRDAPNKALVLEGMAETDVRNAHMVNGLTDLGMRVKEDALLINNALSGARIERMGVNNGV